ncbi:MmyB family transcriptional regulator [Streptomyces chartreusis]
MDSSPHPLKLLLKPKRERIRPEDVGLPPRRPGTPGPKQPGLSQSQIDKVLKRGHKTYNRFENGRLDNPPEDFLAALGRLLRLTQDEYALMWVHGRGHQPTVPMTPGEGMTVPSHWQRVVDGQREMAYVTDLAWNVEYSNAPFADMFLNRKVPENTAKWMLLTSEARETLTCWETIWAPSVCAQLRAASTEHPYSEQLKEIAEAVIADPVAGPIYEDPDLVSRAPDGGIRPFRHPLKGPGSVELAAAMPFATPGARLIVVTFIPDEL